MNCTARHIDAGANGFAGRTRALRGIGDLLRTRYPLFLLGLPPPRHEIPVFSYREVDPATFSHELEFLRGNGYRTIGLDEFLAAAAGKTSFRERRVLLTFDNARRSFYEVAFPLLRTFGARATLFVPSYWVQPAAITGARGPAGSPLFMSWEQVRECAESGYVDVQSQGHRHALVATSSQLVDFATPGLLARCDVHDWPMRNTATGERLGPAALGSPIYKAAPLLSAERRYIESPGLTRACTQLVAEAGGQAFFQHCNWSDRLRRLYESRARVLRGELLSSAEFTTLLRSEFELARAAFTANLGYAPTSIAFPWRLGSGHSLELARRAGLRNAFGDGLDYRRARRGGLGLRAFGRLRSDWLALLPGRGRASLLSLTVRKLTTLSRSQPLAH
jgi:peptidoglycan/xylan/chitin deacetylase (PgdA/CDA1 family)